MNREILTVRTTSMTVAGGILTIGIPELTLANNQHFRLILCQTIPADAGVSQVVLQTPTNTIKAFVRMGNYLHADQLRCRRCYDMVFGNDPIHVSMLCGLRRSCFDVAFPGGTAGEAKVASKKAA